MAELITSAANPLVKRVRLLADRKHRRRESAFVVQGLQPVWQAVEAGADIEVLTVTPGCCATSGQRRWWPTPRRQGCGSHGCPTRSSAGSRTATARPGWRRSCGPLRWDRRARDRAGFRARGPALARQPRQRRDDGSGRLHARSPLACQDQLTGDDRHVRNCCVRPDSDTPVIRPATSPEQERLAAPTEQGQAGRLSKASTNKGLGAATAPSTTSPAGAAGSMATAPSRKRR
jgi:hypothetical protein